MHSRRFERPKTPRSDDGSSITVNPCEDENRELEFLKLIIDSIYHGVMITDADGYVTHFNARYGSFLGVNPTAQLGKHCSSVIENSRMDIVARTGIAEINQTHRIKDQDMIVQRIPIEQNGKVVAVFGQVMFKDIRDLQNLARKLNMLESKVAIKLPMVVTVNTTHLYSILNFTVNSRLNYKHYFFIIVMLIY